jgi:ATP-dependent exoDNAse (exonuclease V) beta subunit
MTAALLTRPQRDAVERQGQDVCVVAGPGSGKTRVLIDRFRWRVENGASPLRILAVTFTEKAANELKQRLARHFPSEPRLREQIERAPVHTIDAFCARLVREHSVQAGVDPQFDILEPSDAYAELWSAAENVLDGLFEESDEPVRALLRALDLTDPVAGVLDVYQAMRLSVRPEQGQPSGAEEHVLCRFHECLERIASARPAGWSARQQGALEEVREWAGRALALAGRPPSPDHFRVLAEFGCNLNSLRRGNAVYDDIRLLKQELLEGAQQAYISVYYASERALLWEALGRLDRHYRGRKRQLNVLDFSDLEEFAIRLLRDDEALRTRLRNSFDEILMDELQDTNPLQAELIDLLRRPDRFFAVGDVNQSIYGFRHATPAVFREYRSRIEKAGKRIDRLRENHRSRAPILYAVERVLGASEGIESNPLEPARPFTEKREPSVEVIAAELETAEQASEVEAQCVARRILELEGAMSVQDREAGRERPARFSDITILLRNVNALPPFEQALRRAGVPYLVARGKRFYEAREVIDLVHLLRVIANPRDEVSMAAVLRSPLVGVRNETLLRLKQRGNLGAAVMELDPGDAPRFDSADCGRLLSFRDCLARIRSLAADVSPDRLLLRAMDAADYESRLEPPFRANVRKLLARFREWHEREPRPLLRLVEELEFLRASDPDEPTAPPDDSSNAVRVMTVHSAKGLEFPIVFLAALHKGVANDSPVLAYSPSAGLVARWRDPATGKPVKDLPYSLYSEKLKRKAREEENRVLYVGMTRAEEHLVLSFAKTARAPRNWADKVVQGFALDLGVAPDVPFVHRVGAEGAAFDVRVWRVSARLEAIGRAHEPADVVEEERVALPLVSDQHDTAASVTSIALFNSCPRRYYLSRYLGWDGAPRRQVPLPRFEVEDESVDAGELGRRVHDMLAGLPVTGASSQVLDLVTRFESGEIGRRIASARRVEREFEFILAVHDVVVQGRIDLWFEDAAGLVVLDYKTDDVPVEEAEARAESYALQLQLYSIALQALTGKLPDQAIVYLLRPNLPVAIDLGPAALEAAREVVLEFRDAQSSLRFPLRIDDHCHRCSFYRGLCPAGRTGNGS